MLFLLYDHDLIRIYYLPLIRIYIILRNMVIRTTDIAVP